MFFILEVGVNLVIHEDDAGQPVGSHSMLAELSTHSSQRV